MASHLRIKICGITNAADARKAADHGADAIGLNFYPRSARYLDPALAAPLLRQLPPFVEAVGLFVEQSLAEAMQTLAPLGRIRTIQWHGQRHEVRDPQPYSFIPAFHIHDRASLDDVHHYLAACRAIGYTPDGVLVDAHVPGQYGGTGCTAPWELVADFRPGVPVILAGGLTPENVAEAVAVVRPYGVDVASGVESQPGIKDEDKVRRFVAAARAVEQG